MYPVFPGRICLSGKLTAPLHLKSLDVKLECPARPRAVAEFRPFLQWKSLFGGLGVFYVCCILEMYMNQLIVSKAWGAQWKVPLVALSQAKPGKPSMARAVGSRQELGQNLRSNIGFCLCHNKASRGEGLSLLWTQLGDDQTCLNTHKLWMETRWAWGSNRGTGSRSPDLLQMVQPGTATDPWVTLDEPLPFFVPLCPAIFYLPLSYRLWAVCFRHVCTALSTKGPWSHWWPLSPSATRFIIK